MKIDEGLAAAKESNKLAMVVVHKSWCGACKRLGPSFAGEQRVKDLADNFVMINVHDDGACSDSQPPPAAAAAAAARVYTESRHRFPVSLERSDSQPPPAAAARV